MPRIESNQKEIVSRQNKIRKLLNPISRIKGGPVCTLKPLQRKLILATHDGSPPLSDFTSWRFTTKHSAFRALYYEMWTGNGTNIFSLDKAYLHIYQMIDYDEREYLLLHCDPDEPDIEKHALYKRGPHLHISVAEQPIPHSHIALCLSNLDSTLNSVDSLTTALELCIKMICEQFLEITLN
jgi:hypothetical protein